jgi:hypothetical protein
MLYPIPTFIVLTALALVGIVGAIRLVRAANRRS